MLFHEIIENVAWRFHFFILRLISSRILCLFNQGQLFHFKQIITEAKKITKRGYFEIP